VRMITCPVTDDKLPLSPWPDDLDSASGLTTYIGLL